MFDRNVNASPLLVRPRWTADDLMLAILVCISLLPIWLFPFFPTQDGPAHVENANILLNYWNAAQPQWRTFYEINLSSPTNWLGHILLATLMTFAPPAIAEKLFLSAYVILFPLTVRYALKGMPPEAGVEQGGWLAILAIPFLYTFVLYKGFYNFLASLPLFFFLIGSWIRRRDQLAIRSVLLLAVLSLVLYAAHALTWVMAALGIGVMVCWFSALDLVRARAAARTIVARRIALALVVLIVPAILLLDFVARGTGEPLRLGANWGLAVWNFVRLTAIVALDERDYWFASALVLGLAALLVYRFWWRVRERRLYLWDGWLIVGGLYFIVYLAAPASLAGGSFVKPRLMLFVCFAILLWLGSQSYARSAQRVTQVLVSGWVIALLLIRLGAQGELNSQLVDVYSTAAYIAPRATILPLTFASHVAEDADSPYLSRIRVLLHGTGYVAARGEAVNLANYEARTDYFPLRFNPARSPVSFFTRLSSGAPTIELERYERERGGRVDYVILLAEDAPFGAGFEPPTDVLDQLAANYELVFTSPRGLARVYRHKP